MATTVRRRVTYIKVKKGQVKKKRPSTDVNTGRSGQEAKSEATLDGAQVVIPRPQAPARPWWKMAWIPVLVLFGVGIFFMLAMGVGDNLRSRSNEIDLSSDQDDSNVRADLPRKRVAYPDNGKDPVGNVDGRKRATDKSFLATQFSRGGSAGGGGGGGSVGSGGGGGNGGVPVSAQGSASNAPAASRPSANCVLSYGGNAADLSQRLGDCLSKQ